jgi:hypothetical protein
MGNMPESQITLKRDRTIGAAGFEPTTPTTPKWCATKLRYAPAEAKLSQRFAPFQPLQQPGREALASQAAVVAEVQVGC